MFPHFINLKLFIDLKKIAALELHLLFINHKKESKVLDKPFTKTEGFNQNNQLDMGPFFIKVIDQETKTKIFRNFDNLKTSIQTTDEIQNLQSRLVEAHKEVVFKSKRPIEYFSDIGMILYSFLGKKKSIEIYKEIKSSYAKTMIAQHKRLIRKMHKFK